MTGLRLVLRQNMRGCLKSVGDPPPQATPFKMFEKEIKKEYMCETSLLKKLLSLRGIHSDSIQNPQYSMAI